MDFSGVRISSLEYAFSSFLDYLSELDSQGMTLAIKEILRVYDEAGERDPEKVAAKTKIFLVKKELLLSEMAKTGVFDCFEGMSIHDICVKEALKQLETLRND